MHLSPHWNKLHATDSRSSRRRRFLSSEEHRSGCTLYPWHKLHSSPWPPELVHLQFQRPSTWIYQINIINYYNYRHWLLTITYSLSCKSETKHTLCSWESFSIFCQASDWTVSSSCESARTVKQITQSCYQKNQTRTANMKTGCSPAAKESTSTCLALLLHAEPIRLLFLPKI